MNHDLLIISFYHSKLFSEAISRLKHQICAIIVFMIISLALTIITQTIVTLPVSPAIEQRGEVIYNVVPMQT